MAKEKVEAEQITEVVEEAKTEAETILQAQAEGAAIRTKMKVQANNKLMDKGMTNPKSNVIIVRNMGTTPMDVEKKQNDMNSRQNANFENEEDKNLKIVLLTCNIAEDK